MLSLVLPALAVIIIATFAMLKLARIKGLRSSRGLAVFLLFILSWLIGFLLAHTYLPLAIIAPPLVQVGVLAGVARIPPLRSLLIAILYTIGVIVAVYGVTTLALAWDYDNSL